MTLKSSSLRFSLLCFLYLTGCAVIDNRGHEVEKAQLSQIKVGITTREEVAKRLGTPSAVSTFGNKTWFYIAEITQRRAFFAPQVLKGQVVRIEFDPSGRVQSVCTLTEKDMRRINHSADATPTSGHRFGVLEQIFGNVGRFNGKDPDK